MNVAHCSFLLGEAFSLIKQVRAHLIKNQDAGGIEIIEDQYQALESGIISLYYGERKHD